MTEHAERLHEESAAPQVNCEVLVAPLNFMQPEKTLQSLVQAQQKQPTKRLEYDQLCSPRKIPQACRSIRPLENEYTMNIQCVYNYTMDTMINQLFYKDYSKIIQ
jgi:hypothetical protein